MEHKAVKRQRAFAIVTVMIVSVICIILITALVSRISSHTRRMRRGLNTQAGAYLAEAGLNHALAYFPNELESNTTPDHLYGALPTGGYHAACLCESALGPLGQKVAHIVVVGHSDDGGRGGCLLSFELYPPVAPATVGMLIPICYSRFDRDIDLHDSAALQELVTADSIIDRRQRLKKRYENLAREVAMSDAAYSDALDDLGSNLPIQHITDDWPDIKAALLSVKYGPAP